MDNFVSDFDDSEPSSSVSAAHDPEVNDIRNGQKYVLKHADHSTSPAEAIHSQPQTLTKYSISIKSKPARVLQPSISASDLLWSSKVPQVAVETQQLKPPFPQTLASSVTACQLSSLESVTSSLIEHVKEQKSMEVKRKILKQVKDFIQGQNARFERLAEIANRQNSLLEQFANHMVLKEQQEQQIRRVMQQRFGQMQQMAHFYNLQHQQHQQFIHQLRQLQLEFLYELHDHHQCYMQRKGSS